MTYNVFSGTLNRAQSILYQSVFALCLFAGVIVIFFQSASDFRCPLAAKTLSCTVL